MSKKKKKQTNLRRSAEKDYVSENTTMHIDNSKDKNSSAKELVLAEISKPVETIRLVNNDDEINIMPCVILSGADTGIKVHSGINVGGIISEKKNPIALFAKRNSRPSSNKTRTSLRTEDIESAISKGKNSSDKNNGRNNRDNRNRDNRDNRDNRKKSNNSINPNMNYIFAGIGAVVVCFLLIFIFTNKNANQVFVNDKAVGIIKDKNITAEQIQENAVTKLKTDKNVDVKVKEAVTLKPVHAAKKEISNLDYIISAVSNSFTYDIGATAVYVNGKKIGIVQNNDTANKVLDIIKAKNKTENSETISVDFFEKVELKDEFISSENIESEETLLNKLTATTNEPKTYKVVAGDTLSSIASGADMSLDDLYNANPGITENINIDQVVNLVVPKPVLSVKTTEKITKEEPIDYEITYVDNNNEYKTYEKVITKGVEGKRKAVYRITKVNGIIEGEPQLIKEETEVISEPVNKVVERGTLQTPPKRAVGSFIYPTLGRLSSSYGPRWGRNHKGIDLASAKGSPIYASDGGTVEFSGWNSGGYGNLVIINHGNGYSTYYGHNSKNVVSAGEKVYQGQLIAYVGSTGDSTGNHVHFEVRKNGVAQNPINYLG